MKTKEEKAAYMRAYRKKNYELVREIELRMDVLCHYGGTPPQCACCGETSHEFLAIDHINGGGLRELKRLKIKGGQGMYRYLRLNGYPEGYRILCHNCNFARSHYGMCPHEREWASVKGA